MCARSALEVLECLCHEKNRYSLGRIFGTRITDADLIRIKILMDANGELKPRQRKAVMSSINHDEPGSSSSVNSISPNKQVRRLILYAAVLAAVFLAGLVPMWLRSRTTVRERDAAQASLRISNLQNSLANAAIDARRGDYEPARQATSDFFTNLTTEIARGSDSAFNEAQRNALRSMFDTRDDTITLLARSDPASTDRLVDLYTKYRQVIASVPAH